MTSFILAPEVPGDSAEIDLLHAQSFGPGRFARAAFRLREQGPHDIARSFVVRAEADGSLVGSVRLTPVIIVGSGQAGFLLGPLAVNPAMKNRGWGRKMVAQAIDAACLNNAPQLVILVGDPPYYAPLGFEPTPPYALKMPGPVDPGRILVHPNGAVDPAQLAGLITHRRVAGV